MEARRASKSDPSEMIKICNQLLEQHDIEVCELHFSLCILIGSGVVLQPKSIKYFKSFIFQFCIFSFLSLRNLFVSVDNQFDFDMFLAVYSMVNTARHSRGRRFCAADRILLSSEQCWRVSAGVQLDRTHEGSQHNHHAVCRSGLFVLKLCMSNHNVSVIICICVCACCFCVCSVHEFFPLHFHVEFQPGDHRSCVFRYGYQSNGSDWCTSTSAAGQLPSSSGPSGP